jgi:hypothetical protein
MRKEGWFLNFVGKMLMCWLFFSVTTGLSSAFGASLNLGEATGIPGSDVTISVTLSTGGLQIAATADDIGFNTSLLENPRLAIGPAGDAAGKEVVSSTPSSGVFRIGILGMNTTPIGDGIVAYVTFKIKSTAPSGDTPLNNTPSATNPSGNPISISGSNGMVHIQTSPPAQLNLGSGSGSPGGSVTLPITLVTNGWSISATSNDLQYNGSYLKNPQCSIGPSGSAAGKSAQCNQVSPGLFRIGVLGFNTTPIGDGVVAYVTFDIDPSVSPGAQISVDNTPNATDPDGNLVSVIGSDGLITANALEISPSSFPSVLQNIHGFAGVQAQWQFQVAGGEAPYAWSIVEGALPNGLALNSTTGLISGKPLGAGEFAFKLKVIDKNLWEAIKDLSLKISLLGDANGDGVVSINELQIAINSYLGVYPSAE